ncbi:hypothetical protein MC28_E040 (plasmid) [Bacillus thuringiensis MC28]|nr:hypothetical protein MC28_E040 [Bacillus thuringiensis MC28]
MNGQADKNQLNTSNLNNFLKLRKKSIQNIYILLFINKENRIQKNVDNYNLFK